MSGICYFACMTRCLFVSAVRVQHGGGGDEAGRGGGGNDGGGGRADTNNRSGM